MIMGVPGSGSTLITNLCRELRARAYIPKEAINPKLARLNVGKMHGYGVHDIGICTIRDFRDAFFSGARRWPGANIDEKARGVWKKYVEEKDYFNITGAKEDPRVRIFRYEDYLPGPMAPLLDRLRVWVEVPPEKITLEDYEEIENVYNIDHVAENPSSVGYCRFMSNHITTRGKGGWKNQYYGLSQEMKDKFVGMVAPLLIEYGYEKDDSWAASKLQTDLGLRALES
jgi:hypothetical protein